jgi:hypothetical protein
MLKDPSNDRIVKNLRPPPSRPLMKENVFIAKKKSRTYCLNPLFIYINPLSDPYLYRQARLETSQRSYAPAGFSKQRGCFETYRRLQ